jgi:hypothetical protein
MKYPPKPGLICLLLVLLFSSCSKTLDSLTGHSGSPRNTYYKYIIPQGAHYATDNSYQQVLMQQLNFVVKFDSSAIYQSIDPNNQEDINKLYGFSDNSMNHQQYSARFGWNWTRGALRLYAYTYNNSLVSSQEITAIQIGQEYNCSITVSNDKYIFLVNSIQVEMNRSSTTPQASGYKLYPYFGGNETAPHEVDIWIKEV